MPVTNSAFGDGLAGLGGGTSRNPPVFDTSEGTPIDVTADQLNGVVAQNPTNPDYTPDSPTPEATVGGRWAPAEEGDGLSIDLDGTINFPGLRDARQTFFFNYDQHDSTTVDGHTVAGDITKVYLLPYDMRMTVAIPCDHRVTKAVRMSVDPREKVPLINDVANDANRMAPGFRRTYFVDAGMLYRKEIRKGGYPIPGSIPGITGSTFRDGILADDSNLLDNHGRKKAREFCRLDKAETLSTPHILNTVHVGDMVSQLDNGYNVAACVQGVHFFYTPDGGGQRMERKCG